MVLTMLKNEQIYVTDESGLVTRTPIRLNRNMISDLIKVSDKFQMPWTEKYIK